MFEDRFSEVGTYILTVKLLHWAWLCMLNPYLPAQTRCLCMQLDVLQTQRQRQVQTLAFSIFMTVLSSTLPWPGMLPWDLCLWGRAQDVSTDGKALSSWLTFTQTILTGMVPKAKNNQPWVLNYLRGKSLRHMMGRCLQHRFSVLIWCYSFGSWCQQVKLALGKMLNIILTSALRQSSGLVSVLWDNGCTHGQLQAMTILLTLPTSVHVTSGRWLKFNMSMKLMESCAWVFFVQPVWMGFWVCDFPLPEPSGAELSKCRTVCRQTGAMLNLDWRMGLEVVEMDQLCMEGTGLYWCCVLQNIVSISACENCLCFLHTGNYGAIAAGCTSVSKGREKLCSSLGDYKSLNVHRLWK